MHRLIVRTAARSTPACMLACALVSLLAVGASARAQEAWPSRPVEIVMGFPAGSGVDVVARALEVPLGKALGATIVFEYKPGAGGNLASEFVARAKPDGYTLLLGTAATHGINAALYSRLPFDVETDFAPIAPLVDVSNALTINASVIDAKTVKEFIQLVKANPGKYNYASTGNGTGTHLAFAEFNAKAGLDMVHVPYKGGPEALQAVLKGDVCCIFNQVQTVLSQYRAGKVRLLGVTTRSRVGVIPEVPTIAEAALPGFESYTWFGVFGPRGLNPALATRINAAIRASLELPAIQQKFIDSGNTPRLESVEQFRATVKTDRAKWATVVKSTGATVD